MKSQQWMVRLAVVVVGVGAARAQAPVSGGLTGRVTDDGGRGLPGVVVTALATVAGPIAPPPPTVVSGANGAFSFSGLAVGPYRLCLRAQAAYLLDPCEWGGKGVPAAAIPSGANAAANTVKLARGHLVHVQFADPGGLLTARTGQGRTRIMCWWGCGKATGCSRRRGW